MIGWWLTYPSEKLCDSVGTIIPNVWKKNGKIELMFQTTNQMRSGYIAAGEAHNNQPRLTRLGTP
jgi:hypothetical protein